MPTEKENLDKIMELESKVKELKRQLDSSNSIRMALEKSLQHARIWNTYHVEAK